MSVLLFLAIGFLLVVGIAYASAKSRLKMLERESYIRSLTFPSSLLATLGRHHGHLTEKDYFLVARALREFFLVRLKSGNQFIGMPSKAVDDLWHEFILQTQAYATFCDAAFGKFFHHVPAAATPKGTDISSAMQLTWRYACLEENINPANPTRMPLLFAIDEKLGIEGGHHYNLKMGAKRANAGCGGSACGSGQDAGEGGGGDSSCGGGCGGD